LFFRYNSPPTNSEGSQPKTQAVATQEELTQDERPCSIESTAEMDSNGQIQSVLPIIKSPSPDVHGHYPPVEPEPLGQKRTGLQRYSDVSPGRTTNLIRRPLKNTLGVKMIEVY